MEERNYQVQEAVRLIGVESHVLRYWEEELGITVGRTKQGYRIYSEANIRLFRQIKELKEQGIGLKAIRRLLGGTGDERAALVRYLEQTADVREENQEKREVFQEVKGREEKEAFQEAKEREEKETFQEAKLEYEVITEESPAIGEFEKILKRIIREAVEDQNEKLELAVTELIRDELEIQLDAILDAMREAAAEREESKNSVLRRIKKWFGNKKGHPI